MIKKTIFSLTNLLLLITSLSGQSFLTPSEGLKAFNVFPEFTTLGAFDLHNSLLYANDGDTIHCLNLQTGQEENKFGIPAGYKNAYESFITITPDGRTIWAGYTVFGNSDDRIYSVDVASGEWELQAKLPGNFDLEFWNNSILVSGLNSTDWNDPGSIFLLDTSGLDQHRKIVEAGGYAAGITLDAEGNLYYGTSYSMDPNAIFRWDSVAIASILETPGAGALNIEDGEKLTNLPSSASDCDVDEAGNIIFTFNDLTSDKVLAKWNGIQGEGENFDTLSVASAGECWLGMVKSQGNINNSSSGNKVFTTSYGHALAEVHLDYLPVLVKPLPLFSGLETEQNESFDLSNHFTDPDDDDAFIFKLVANSDPLVAEVIVDAGELLVDFLSVGQTNIFLEASNAGKSISGKTVIGVQPIITGENVIADFEDLNLDLDSYWNGSDGSGGFITSDVHFYNDYNADWFSWNGWAYSNITDNTTPGFVNQYSAKPGTGFDDGTGIGGNYGVGYVFGSPVLNFTDTLSHEVAGLFVTNSTYAALSIEDGDTFSKKFGGEGGGDPDYFKLMVWGRTNGLSTGSAEFFLADYRFENDTMDYLIQTWQWVDLRSLGSVDSLMFALESSDTGDLGMNTPAFFCIDHLQVVPNEDPVGDDQTLKESGFDLLVYPNPSAGKFRIELDYQDKVGIKVYNLTGAILYEDLYYSPGEVIDIVDFTAGSYFIRVIKNQEVFSKIIQKQ